MKSNFVEEKYYPRKFSFSFFFTHNLGLNAILINYIKSSRGSSGELPVWNRNEAVMTIFLQWENLWGLPPDCNYLKLHLSFLGFGVYFGKLFT